jgi:hypothetical protein
VIVSDPGREFASTVAGPGGKTSTTWRYQPGPGAEGTDVTESFELSGTLLTRLYRTLAGRARRRTNLVGTRATLEKIKDGRRIPGFFRLASRTGSAPA